MPTRQRYARLLVRESHGGRPAYLTKPLPHPRPWEKIVQSGIRTINPASNDQGTVLLGEDHRGIGAVAVVGIEHDPSAVLVDCIAVALHYRYTGGGHADEAMDVVQQWALAKADAAGHLMVQLSAKRDPQNVASGHLLQRWGFSLREYDGPLEVWATPLRVSPRD